MRTVLVSAVAVIALIVLAGAAFVYSGAYYVGADKPHWSLTAWLLNEARNRSVRAHALGIVLPADLDDQVKIVSGVSHYAEHCAVCHGAPGVERGDLAKGLNPPPPNLADAPRVYTPGELFWIVKHGIRMTGMPGWGDHSDDELWATVAFIQKLPGMTDQEYAKLAAASRAQGGHQHQSEQPSPEPSPQSADKDHDHSAAPGVAQRLGGAGHDHSGKKHQHKH